MLLILNYYFRNKLTETNDSRSVWNAYNEISGRSRNAKTLIKELTVSGNLTTNKVDMTNELANNMVINHNQNADKIVSFLGTLETATPVKLECSELLTAYNSNKKI